MFVCQDKSYVTGQLYRFDVLAPLADFDEQEEQMVVLYCGQEKHSGKLWPTFLHGDKKLYLYRNGLYPSPNASFSDFVLLGSKKI